MRKRTMRRVRTPKNKRVKVFRVNAIDFLTDNGSRKAASSSMLRRSSENL